jgi:hypothetical protein
MSRISKNDFASRFEMGVPLDESKPGDEDVLLLYSSTRALPLRYNKEVTSLNTPIPLMDVEDATHNCDEMHIILTDHSRRKQCIAMVPQYESFHIQKWMRVDGDGGPMNNQETLKHVSRGYQSNGRQKFLPPEPTDTRLFWKMLAPYIDSIDEVLDKLKPLVEKVATADKQLIVMVCNMGQSELLMNFVCAAKKRGLDYSHVLVFATDLETKTLAEGVGLTAFFDEIVSTKIVTGQNETRMVVYQCEPHLYLNNVIAAFPTEFRKHAFGSRTSIRRSTIRGDDVGKSVLCSNGQHAGVRFSVPRC